MERQELLRLEAEAVAELSEARAAMPAHSIRPHQQQRLEEAEDRAAEIRARLKALGPAE